MARLLVLFDTKSDATAALDQFHSVDREMDLRVFEHNDPTVPGAMGVAAPAQPMRDNIQGAFVPVTGFRDLGLNDEEEQYFKDRMRGDSSLVIAEASEEHINRLKQIARQYNGLIYEEND